VIKQWMRRLACAAAGVLALQAHGRAFDVGPPPAWVEPRVVDTSSAKPTEELSDGVHVLLVDEQVRYDGREFVAYAHRALRAVNERGVEFSANVKVRFDPAYERLTLHSIVVRRGGSVVSRHDPAAVRVLQRETDLEALIFDGSKTAHAFLENVRVGDVVEYAYSLRGSNPVFGGRQFGRFGLQWSVPVAEAQLRLLWPAGRELQWRAVNGAPAPAVRDADGFVERRWHLLDVAGRRVENDAPAWYDPYPAVEWSEFRDWRAVVRWAQPLYTLPATLPKELEAEAARIRAAHAEPERRLAAALRFVQREVRYLGFEIGPGSHAPSAPETVLRRRFGDCKDKTLLTLALLRALDIPAWPALVHTGWRHAIDQRLASPGAFNHVLVLAQTGTRRWWVDPTRAPQEAPLERLAPSDFGRALVIDADGGAPVAMAADGMAPRRREVRTLIDASGGFDRPARYTVTTRAQGGAAEALRAALAGESRDETQKRYVNSYTRYYAGIAVAAPMEVRDEQATNTLTTVEHYTITDFWRRAEKAPRFEVALEVPELYDYVRTPARVQRDSPLAVAHPHELENVVQVKLAGDWNIKPARDQIDAAAFTFVRELRWPERNLLELHDRFRSLRDHVPATEVAQHAQQLAKVRELIDFGLQHQFAATPAAGSGQPHWQVVAFVGPALMLLLFAAWRLYLWDPVPNPPAIQPFGNPPQGLGGWLALLGLACAVGLVRNVTGLSDYGTALVAERWSALTVAGGAEYHPLWMPLLLAELALSLALIAGLALFLVLYLQRRSSAPAVLVGVQVIALLRLGIDLGAGWGAPALGLQATTQDFGAVVGSLAWIAYVRRSMRVRATFVRRRGAPSVQSSTALSPSTTPS
jgi:hypothetical protein